MGAARRNKGGGKGDTVVDISRVLTYLPLLRVVTLAYKEPSVNTPETLTKTDLEKADAEAVMDHYLHGKPIDPEVARRP
jgi:hypothetical protein